MGTLIAVLLGLAASPAPAAEKSITLDPAAGQGKWEGWGVSLAWWAAVFGDRNDLADAVFTTRAVKVDSETLPGLGLTMVRYNAGASSWNEIGGRKMGVSKIIHRYRQMEGFWLDDRSADPKSPSWDWSVDGKQRAMMAKAKDRGVNKFELFSNSPMWWMTRNDNPSGGPKPTDDNLAAEHEKNFAIYLATVARHAADHWGIRFTTVAPFNEPVSHWWFDDCKQEGCHFSPPAQARMLALLRPELDRQGFKDLPIAASEETYYDHAIQTWESFDKGTRALIGQYNVHGYQEANGDREKLHRLVHKEGGKPLWNSEYGDGDRAGLNMAHNLHRDMDRLRPTSWSYWQVVDGGGWGLIAADMVRARLQRPNPKWFVLAQYTRHIPAGATILTTHDESTVAAYDSAKRELTFVCLNESDAPRDFRIHLGKFAKTDGTAATWLTCPTRKILYRPLPAIPLREKSLIQQLPPKSVQTFVIRGVSLSP